LKGSAGKGCANHYIQALQSLAQPPTKIERSSEDDSFGWFLGSFNDEREASMTRRDAKTLPT
jgi:hypothetical protein